jgi:hypothetical protein
MEKVFVIQDVKTKEYFAGWSCGPCFDANVSDAKEYDSVEEAEKELENSNEELTDLTDGRTIEIKKYYKF